MGFEYMLDFEVKNPGEVDGILRSVSGFAGYDPLYGLYYFRRRATGAMPDAEAKIEERGLYLCDNGCGMAVVEDIRAAVGSVAPTAVLHEL